MASCTCTSGSPRTAKSASTTVGSARAARCCAASLRCSALLDLRSARACSRDLATTLILHVIAALARLGELLELRAKFPDFPLAGARVVLVVDDGNRDA